MSPSRLDRLVTVTYRESGKDGGQYSMLAFDRRPKIRGICGSRGIEPQPHVDNITRHACAILS